MDLRISWAENRNLSSLKSGMKQLIGERCRPNFLKIYTTNSKIRLVPAVQGLNLEEAYADTIHWPLSRENS